MSSFCAARKLVRLRRCGAGILRAGVQGVARVHVQIPEKGLHQRLMGIAGLALFCVVHCGVGREPTLQATQSQSKPSQ